VSGGSDRVFQVVQRCVACDLLGVEKQKVMLKSGGDALAIMA
jgi:hypothetical protein